MEKFLDGNIINKDSFGFFVEEILGIETTGGGTEFVRTVDEFFDIFHARQKITADVSPRKKKEKGETVTEARVDILKILS